jgi:hypothetical protein
LISRKKLSVLKHPPFCGIERAIFSLVESRDQGRASQKLPGLFPGIPAGQVWIHIDDFQVSISQEPVGNSVPTLVIM